MNYGITHFEKEPLADGQELISFSFHGHAFKIEAYDFGTGKFQITQIKCDSSFRGTTIIVDMLDAIQLESDDLNDLRNQDHESDASLEEEE